MLAGAVDSAIRDGTCDGPDSGDCAAPATHGPAKERQTGGLRVVAERMGDRWRWPGGRRRRARATTVNLQEHHLPHGQEAYITEPTGEEIREDGKRDEASLAMMQQKSYWRRRRQCQRRKPPDAAAARSPVPSRRKSRKHLERSGQRP